MHIAAFCVRRFVERLNDFAIHNLNCIYIWSCHRVVNELKKKFYAEIKLPLPTVDTYVPYVTHTHRRTHNTSSQYQFNIYFLLPKDVRISDLLYTYIQSTFDALWSIWNWKTITKLCAYRRQHVTHQSITSRFLIRFSALAWKFKIQRGKKTEKNVTLEFLFRILHVLVRFHRVIQCSCSSM